MFIAAIPGPQRPCPARSGPGRPDHGPRARRLRPGCWPTAPRARCECSGWPPQPRRYRVGGRYARSEHGCWRPACRRSAWPSSSPSTRSRTGAERSPCYRSLEPSARGLESLAAPADRWRCSRVGSWRSSSSGAAVLAGPAVVDAELAERLPDLGDVAAVDGACHGGQLGEHGRCEDPADAAWFAAESAVLVLPVDLVRVLAGLFPVGAGDQLVSVGVEFLGDEREHGGS